MRWRSFWLLGLCGLLCLGQALAASNWRGQLMVESLLGLYVPTTDPCDKLKNKDGDMIYPIPADTLACIAWGEISLFDRDNGPSLKDIFAGWNSIRMKTVKAILCRNFKEKGLNKREVGCNCPESFQPPGGEANRQWDDIVQNVDEEQEDMDEMSEAELEKYCDGWYHWYHQRNGGYGGYFNEALEKKTKERHKNDGGIGKPEGSRVHEWRTHGGGEVIVFFPHDDDIDNRFNKNN